MSVRVNANKFIKEIKAVARDAERAGNTIAEKAAEAGAEEMRKLISTRGVGREWDRPWKGKKTGKKKTISAPGRIDSGDMLNSVKSSVNRGPSRTEAVFGWLSPSSEEDKKYFGLQEEGFTHMVSTAQKPVKVIGMFALRDARLKVEKVILPQLAKQNIARLTRGR